MIDGPPEVADPGKEQPSSPKPGSGFLTGRTLGDFFVLNKIGEGGFGEVYRAEQHTLAREAVIKVLRPQTRISSTVTQRFLREAKLASSLDHPFAAHIYAFGAEPDGLLWIAMELVRGTPLNELLKRQGPLSLSRFVPLFERICEVVHTAHDAGIVHRDLKPANVMVLNRAGRLLPKLLDFGIAKLEEVDAVAEKDPAVSGTDSNPDLLSGSGPNQLDDGSSQSSGRHESADGTERLEPKSLSGKSLGLNLATAMSLELTLRGVFMGSPHYMAPEQWLNASQVDSRTDFPLNGGLPVSASKIRIPSA